MPLSTVSAVLKRCGMGRLGRIGLEPARRYERARPGELVHIDVKKLGRIEGGAGKRITDGIKRNPTRRRVAAAGVERKVIGWEYVHIAIDDYSRRCEGRVYKPAPQSNFSGAWLTRGRSGGVESGAR